MFWESSLKEATGDHDPIWSFNHGVVWTCNPLDICMDADLYQNSIEHLRLQMTVG